jgi:UDP-glucose 4-epimerase
MPSELEGKRILVAGAGGFIGRHLVRRLGEAGAEVLAVSKNSLGQEVDRVRWRRGDVRDPGVVGSMFEESNPEIVYQLCGHPSGSRELRLVLPTMENDILTTINLLMAAVEHPVDRFITTASLEEPVGGEAPTCPYAAAKMSSGAYARMFHLLYQVPVVILRPFMTYGPGQPVTKVISYIIQCLLKGEAPRLSSGERMVDWVYIDDVIDGFLAAATLPGVAGSTFDLGSGQMVSIREVAVQLADLIQSGARPAFGAMPNRPFERERIADTRTANERLQWQARVPLDVGLRLTVEFSKKSE